MASWFGSPELKVGALVVTVGALIGGMAMKVAEGPGMLGSKQYFFRADSAGGLVENSAVKMAGIKVGVIRDIILEDGRAKIVIALEGDARITPSSTVELKADGILGDKHVELIPGSPDEPELAAGSELKMTAGKGGLDDVMADVSRVAKSLNELMTTLNKATGEGDDSTSIGRIVGNIEKITADLKQVTGDNKDKIGEIVDRIRNLSKNIDTYINEESLARVDRSLRNIEEITGKLNKGEGTLGRLINDEQTVEELNSAISNVNMFLGGAARMEFSFDFRSEYQTANSQSKSFFGVRIQPGLDRYYELAVVDDPEGTKRSTFTESSSNGGPTNTYQETTYYRNKLKVTALFAKNFWNLTLKGGLIESSGGMGVDYFLLDRRLRLSAEFFDFDEFQVRAFARYNLFKGVYVVAGGENLAGSGAEDPSPFLGAGIFLTNEDLWMLLGAARF